MNKRALHVLEFEKVKKLLAEQAVSKAGRDRALNLEIFTQVDEIIPLQNETKEAAQILVRRSNPPLVGIHHLSNQREHLQLGGSLTPVELLLIVDAMRGARYMKRFFQENSGDRENSYPILEGYISELSTFQSIEREIDNAILSEEEISDNASPKLRSIRRNISLKKDSVRNKLQSIVATAEKQNYLQDSIITMREGRYVIPVKQENKSLIKGLVHDMSSSGATAFIEPMAVVELNNELRQLQIEEKVEIERILQELSSLVAEKIYELSANEQIMIELDFIFAKGKLALLQNANAPILNGKQYFKLKQARHPLLDVKKVVPIDVELGIDFTTLIITGPNTGGKTVTLKTVGLLTLMAQSGLHIPAAEESEIGVFKEVYADIGDEQSIEQSLSTFSSHMVNIVEIIDKVDENSLVLFDELGAGTDPTEGAALAISIIEDMLERNIRTMATTHYNQLKIYALSTDGVANASMEFDIESLSPTYRLLIGMPGKSNAFEISRRLGLQERIIERGKTYINEESLAFEDVLQSIEEERQRLQKSREISEMTSMEMKQRKQKLETELERTEDKKEKILGEAREEARRILLSAKEEAELALSEIKDVSKILEKEEARKLQQAQEYIRKNLREVEAGLGTPIILEEVKRPIEKVMVGDTVYSKSLNSTGTVLELPDKQGQIMVQMGIMKMKLPMKSLVLSKEEEEQAKVKTSNIMKGKAAEIKTEIDIRGKNFEEASAIVDKYLDDAYLSGLKSVRIIHGKGTGVLREKLQPYLRKLKYVRKIKEAPIEEGGSGVTVVELK